ncbi:hypothetical protein KR009_008670, partial [Drosophila setifemur]
KLFVVLLCSLLAIVCLADVSHVKHHKHHRHHEDEDDEAHYLPPQEEKEQPFYKKEKHTSERVVYHKEEEHEEPHHHKEHHEPKEHHEHHHEEPKKQRVDHYHHYDKKPEVKTQHIHYKHSKPHVRTDYNRNQDLFTPAATQVVYHRRRPHRILYASAPNSVFHTHTQINVQSQDSELNSLSRPDQAPVGAQANTGAAPNCQILGPENVPPGCGPSDPLGAQLPASALAPSGGNRPVNQPGFAPVPAGQLAIQGNGQRPGGYGGSGGFGGPKGFFFDPSLGAQLGGAAQVGGGQLAAGQGFSNQNQVDPSFVSQRPAAGQAPAFAGQAQLGAGAPYDPSFGAQRPAAGQAPAFQGQAQLGAGAPYDPSFNAQRPAAGQAQLGAGAPFDPSFAAQRPAAQAPLQNQYNGQFGAPFDPALGAQLGTGQAAPNQRPSPNPPLGAQLGAGQGVADPNQGLFDPSIGAQLAAGQVPRLNNRRPPNRSNYQGLNVLNGNVYGQPHLQGPTNALGNQQDTNIIDGNFFSDPGVHHGHHGHHGALVTVRGNQRSVLVPDDDDGEEDADPGFLAQFAASNRKSTYVAAPKKHGSASDQGTSASEYDTDYREDGYHYQKPKQSFEF